MNCLATVSTPEKIDRQIANTLLELQTRLGLILELCNVDIRNCRIEDKIECACYWNARKGGFRNILSPPFLFFLSCTNEKNMIKCPQEKWSKNMKKNKISTIDKIILGSFIILGVAEASHISTFFLHKSFTVCNLVMGVFCSVLIFASLVFCMWKSFREKKTKQVVEIGTKNGNPNIGLGVLILGLVIFQIIWNFYMHEPYIQEDITIETVQTIRSTNTVYEINPLTGSAFTEGMPLRLKILVLPVLYAMLSQWTNLSPQTICYEIVPILVLILSYLVYSRWAVFLFQEDKKKQFLFILFVALIYQFGSYAIVTDSFGLFTMGYTGETIRRAVILPYVLLSALQKKWLRVVLGIMAEACIVWTLYGLGYSVIVLFLVLLIKGLQSCIMKNKEAGREFT